MSQETWTELHDCAQFLQTLIDEGETDMSPEEAVRLWRADHEEFVEGLREALARSDAGVPGTPHEVFDREFHARHGLPPREASA